MPANQLKIGATIKNNPHLLAADELRAIFIARQKELKDILEKIKNTAPNTVPQHLLITGQRGMGKSTLLNRVALEIDENPDFNQEWLALRFPEEQYTVATLSQLWLNVLDSLADSLPEGSAQQLEIDNFLNNFNQAQGEQPLLDFLQQWCDKQQRRLVLLIDSSDLLLDNLSKTGKKTDASASQLWQLRHTLQTQPCFFWLGGSYQSIDANALYQDTFLDFFHHIELRPLSLKEVKDCLRQLAQVFGIGRKLKGKKAIAEMDRIFSEYPARLKTIHQLSGGNLRTTIILFELFSAGGEDEVQSDLKRLLDDISPLYKARMEMLAEQPRKILAHLFEHWAPTSLAQLSKLSALKKTSITPQLKRLELEGLIETTALPNTTRQGYQVSERLFNIWYLMRNAPRRLRLRLNYLVAFMRLWYDTETLCQMAKHQYNKLCTGQFKDLETYSYSRALADALPAQEPLKQQLTIRAVDLVLNDFSEQSRMILDFEGEDKPFITAIDYQNRLKALPSKLKQLPFKLTKKELNHWVELVLGSLSLDINEKEKVATECKTLSKFQFKALKNQAFEDEIIKFSKIFGEENFQQIRKYILSGEFFPDFPNAELFYQQLMLFADNKMLQSQLLSLYCAKHISNLLEEKKKTYRKAIELDPKDATPWNNLANLLKNQLNSPQEAEKAYRKAIELDPKLAQPWNGLANLLADQLNSPQEAEKAYRKAIELDPKWAYPWNGLANLLADQLNSPQEAEKAYRKAIELNPKWATPWHNLAYLLKNQSNSPQEAEKAYRKAIELDPKNANSWNNLGDLLASQLDSPQEAEKAYQKAIELDPEISLTYANFARLLITQNKAPSDIKTLFRQAISQKAVPSFLRLQAQLYLQNLDLAQEALTELAKDAEAGNNMAFFRLKEQCRECYQMGLATALADLMQNSPQAIFLQPFILALQTVAGDDQILLGAPVEIADMARSVIAEIEKV